METNVNSISLLLIGALAGLDVRNASIGTGDLFDLDGGY